MVAIRPPEHCDVFSQVARGRSREGIKQDLQHRLCVHIANLRQRPCCTVGGAAQLGRLSGVLLASLLLLRREQHAVSSPGALAEGILPSSATATAASRPMTMLEDLPDSAFPEILDRTSPIEMWTDGASSNPTSPQLRRAGWGLWVPGHPEACAAEPLVGPCQTAQRAELRALVAALERSGGFVRVWTDSMFVVRGAKHLQAGRVPPMHHQDLWQRASKAWCRGVSEVRWVKAHLSWPDAQARGIAWQAWAGNQRADELAGQGAAQHAPPTADVARVRQAVSDTEKVQSWMAEALRLAADAAPAAGQTKRARRDRHGHVKQRQQRTPGPPGDHQVVGGPGTHWRCSKCGRRVKKSRGWRTWRRLPYSTGTGPLDRWVQRRASQ